MNRKASITRQSDPMPEPTLRRLPWYLAYLSMLKNRQVEYVSTTRMAEELDVDPSQIAKDLSFLGIKGKTRIGYEVNVLERHLHDFLGFGTRHNALMVGVGSLGAALIADSGLQRYGLNIVAGIDVDPNLIGTSICGVEIFAPDKVPQLVESLGIKIGVLAVPIEAAHEVARMLTEGGVRALWNFTPTRILVPEGVVVANTSIYSHLAVMYNRLSSLNI